jgi:2-iminobutanoate/2-iminopropanoate deaminase
MKSIVLVLISIFIVITGPVQAGGPEVEHYSANEDVPMPFSDAVRVGNMLYLSGKIGNIPGTSQLAEGGITGETRQTLENIKASLEKYGSSMSEVVKCTVFLADIAEWGAMNEVYVTYFPENPPARSALGASGLALNSRVEIECFAAMRD